MFYSTLLVIEVILALMLIGLVLIQQGKGADAGAAFGSGASGTVFGSSGAGSFLTRMTNVLAFLFMVNSLGLAYLIAHREDPTTGNAIESVIDKVDGSGSAIPFDVPIADVPVSDLPTTDIPTPAGDVPTDIPAVDVQPGDVPIGAQPSDAVNNVVEGLQDKAAETKNDLVEKVEAGKEALIDKGEAAVDKALEAVEKVKPADVPQ